MTAQSSCKNENFVNIRKKSLQKQKLKFLRNVLFHMETRVSLKYFVNDCPWKYIFASNLI